MTTPAVTEREDGDEPWNAFNERRRRIIRVLRERNGSLSLSDLAAEVARLEREATDGPAPDRKRIEIRLHHVDLPKLADAGLVIYAYGQDRKVAVFDDSDTDGSVPSDKHTKSARR